MREGLGDDEVHSGATSDLCSLSSWGAQMLLLTVLKLYINACIMCMSDEIYRKLFALLFCSTFIL